MTKCHSLYVTTTKMDDNDDAKATAIPRVFSEKSRAKNSPIAHGIVKGRLVDCIGV